MLLSPSPIFADEFNQSVGSQPSSSTWTTFNATDPNNQNVVYTNSASTLHVVSDAAATDGRSLAMTLSPDASSPGKFNSSEIRTSVDPVAGQLQYGHIEARIKLPGGPNGQGNGIWPAFWMLGANFDQVSWPECGEIDIMENKGSEPGTSHGTIHGPGYQATGLTSAYSLPAGQAFYSAYHVFALDWAPGSVQLSIDGHVYAQFTPSSVPAGGTWEFDHPFYIILDVAEGGPFAGPADSHSVYPQTMYVDYVRAYADAFVPPPPAIDFFGLPASYSTNINTMLVSGAADPASTVTINGIVVPDAERDVGGAFAKTVPLSAGSNKITLKITSSSGSQIATTTKTIVYDPSFSTSGRELLYVDTIGDSRQNPLDGTVVIDPSSNQILGVLDGHVRGISPNGREIYMSDRSVLSTSTHALLRTLQFSHDIPASGFVVSPDGKTLYSDNEVLDVASNTRLTALPVSITLPEGYDHDPAAGGPAITSDGAKIYTISSGTVIQINTAARDVVQTGIVVGANVSDLKLSGNGKYLLVSHYAGNGLLDVFDAQTFQPVTTYTTGDFAGEVGVAGTSRIILGSAGNPVNGGGGLLLADVPNPASGAYLNLALAENVAVNPTANEVFASSGADLGVAVLTVDASSNLVRTKSFVLGTDRDVGGAAHPADQIRGLFIKHLPPGAWIPVSSPRSTPVSTATITFSEPLQNVNLNNFSLNGTKLSTLSGVSIAPNSSPNTYVISGLSAYDSNGNPAKSYTVAVVAGNTLKNMAGTPFSGTPSVTWTMDTVAPKVVSINRLSPANSTTNATSVKFLITFSEKVKGVDTNVATDFALAGSASAGGKIGTPTTSDGGLTWSIPVSNLSSSANGSLQVRLVHNNGITDLAGNALTGGTWSSAAYTLDHSAPVLKSLNRLSPANPFTKQTSVTFLATYSEQVSGVNVNVATDFALAGTAVSGGKIGTPTTSNGGLSWSIPVTSLGSNANGTVQLRFIHNTGIADLAGNALTGGTWTSAAYTLDHTAPAMKSINRLSPMSQVTSATSVTFLATFSEKVLGVDTNVAADFALTGTATAGGKIGTPMTTDGGLTWSIAVTGLSSSANGTVQLHFIHNTGITDLAGNAQSSGTWTSQSYTLQHSGPATKPQAVQASMLSPNRLDDFWTALAGDIASERIGMVDWS